MADDEHTTDPDSPTRNPRTGLRGMTVDASDPDRLREAIDFAVDYRGDVTISRVSSGDTIEGYVFDRRAGESASDWTARVMTASDERISIPFDDIAQIEFTGRDTAEGRSFETWMKKYVEKKLAGEEASIQCESTAEEPE